jgi:hypothetical protein
VFGVLFFWQGRFLVLFRYPAVLISTQRLRGSENSNDKVFFVTTTEKTEIQRRRRKLSPSSVSLPPLSPFLAVTKKAFAFAVL